MSSRSTSPQDVSRLPVAGEGATPQRRSPVRSTDDAPLEQGHARDTPESGAALEPSGDGPSAENEGACALPNEPAPGDPPLPPEPARPPEDDGWDCQWDPNGQAWFFYNRFSGKSQWENPRVSSESGAAPATTAASAPLPPDSEKPAAGGYNPAIHGDYDPSAWYAQGDARDGLFHDQPLDADVPSDHLAQYASTASFNRHTGQFQTPDMGPGRHSDEAKSRRQMNAFFDVDAAANAHDGRSLKAERSNKKPSKAELKAFKEKRRAKKEEKRRAWLRD